MNTPEMAHDAEDDGDGLFEFANISPKQTGLPFVVWISPDMGQGRDIQVRISYGTQVSRADLIPVALCPEVRVTGGCTLEGHNLDLLKQWVALNFDLILDYWEGRIDTFEVLTSITSVSS